MTLSIIVAVTADNAIGAGGDLLFHIPGDLRHFKQVTMGHPVIMGRKTFMSLPKGPLPGRLNVVISTRMEQPADGSFKVARSLPEAIAEASVADGGDELFIMGGGEIYRQALPLANLLYLTRIDATAPHADTFFPDIDTDEWHTVEASETQTTPAGIAYSFITLERKK
ncbi:MAG: dihydrofolate reductase [Muribaculaceae bacterium]|nr:dihydrofolate reductase [Muribaculaceae bacterium]